MKIKQKLVLQEIKQEVIPVERQVERRVEETKAVIMVG
jgi:hypothetical protein